MNSTITEMIQGNDGWIPFDRFMNAALYEPGHGYYEMRRVFGEQGDFITAPAMGPWLSLAMADLVCWGWESLGRPAEWSLLEQGGGEGNLLVAVTALLHERKIVQPTRIIAVEQSCQMRQRQKTCYAEAGLSVIQTSCLSSVAHLENCIFLCNELFDAFPARCFEFRNASMLERGVSAHNGGFIWQCSAETLNDGPDIDPELITRWQEGYCSEWNPGLAGWQQDVAAVIQRGYLFCVDYGYTQTEYYRPQRCEGTLLAHSGHRTREDILLLPGSMDITAHVDFSALQKAGQDHGMQGTTFMTQGAWMSQSPIVLRRIEAMANTPEWASGEAENIKRLLMPFGMGELFKLYIQSAQAPVVVPPFLSRYNRIDCL